MDHSISTKSAKCELEINLTSLLMKRFHQNQKATRNQTWKYSEDIASSHVLCHAEVKTTIQFPTEINQVDSWLLLAEMCPLKSQVGLETRQIEEKCCSLGSSKGSESCRKVPQTGPQHNKQQFVPVRLDSTFTKLHVNVTKTVKSKISHSLMGAVVA